MAANLGLALDDMAVAPLLYKQAVEEGDRHLATIVRGRHP